MIEPTETESRETLDKFVEVLETIRAEMESAPDLIKQAPTTTVVRKLDEVGAAKNPVFRYRPANS